jgi:F-type H+-transporting ATPase subunit b
VLINWFTVVAQIINFLILIVLLKVLLYDRIVKAMDAREEKIRERLNEATRREAEAEKQAEALRQKNRTFDEEQAKMFSRAKAEVEAKRKELLHEIRQSITSLQTTWREAIHRERESFVRDLHLMAGRQTYAIARQALRDLADADLEERTARIFVTQIVNMQREQSEVLAQAIKDGGNQVLIRSAATLASATQGQITQGLRQVLGDGIDVVFETAPDLILGVELKAGGQKVFWSIEHYLDELEEKALQALEREAQRRAPARDAGEKPIEPGDGGQSQGD